MTESLLNHSCEDQPKIESGNSEAVSIVVIGNLKRISTVMSVLEQEKSPFDNFDVSSEEIISAQIVAMTIEEQQDFFQWVYKKALQENLVEGKQAIGLELGKFFGFAFRPINNTYYELFNRLYKSPPTCISQNALAYSPFIVARLQRYLGDKV